MNVMYGSDDDDGGGGYVKCDLLNQNLFLFLVKLVFSLCYLNAQSTRKSAL